MKFDEIKFDNINAEEADKKYNLGNYVNTEYSNSCLYTGDLIIDDDFILDFYKEDENLYGYIIDGDLIVNGNIINNEMDYGPYLLVACNVKIKNMNKE